MLGAAYTDTSLFGRELRPEAVGARVRRLDAADPGDAEADQLYSILVWQSGKGPEAKTFKVLVQAPLIFYTALHLAGPEPHRRRRSATACSGSRPGETHPTQLHLSWGDHGIWPSTDYFGSDDATQIWWNPNAAGRRRGRQRRAPACGSTPGVGSATCPGQWPDGRARRSSIRRRR